MNGRYNFVLTRDKRLKETRPSLHWCGHSERVASVRERQQLGAGLHAYLAGCPDCKDARFVNLGEDKPVCAKQEGKVDLLEE